MALDNKFRDSITGRKFDFILAEDEADATNGRWLGLQLAPDENGLPFVREGRTPPLGQRISEGRTSAEDRDPLSSLIWRQDDWSGGALVRSADIKNDGYLKGSFDAAWGTLAPGIAKNYGSDRGNTRQPIGWLLRNPHFESDADDGWSDDSGGSGTVDMQATDEARTAILGNQSCEITWTGTTADVDIISQSLSNPTVYQSRSLTVSCYFKKTAGSGGVQIEIADGVGSTRGTGVTSASDWTLVTVTRTIDASASEVTITLETEDTNTFTGYVDDFTVYSSSTNVDPVGIVTTDNGDVYMAAGTIVAKLNVGTTDQFRWDAVYVAASALATDIIVFRDQSGSPATQVYVGFGNSAGYIYGTGTSWTVSTLTGDSKFAYYFAVSRNTLWKNESVNSIKSATNPLNAGSWGSAYTVGDANRPITDLYSFNDTVYVGKEDGLWKYRRTYNDGTSADIFENQTSEFATQPNERHFKNGSEGLDGFLYLPLGRGGMMRTNGSALQDVSAIFTKPASGINGVVYTMAQDTKNLWMFVDDRLVSLIYGEDGRLVPHTRGDQPSVSPEALAGSEAPSTTTSDNNSGTETQDSSGSGGATVNWQNVSLNIRSDNGAYATYDTDALDEKTNILTLTNFSFSIPAGVEITGIQVKIGRDNGGTTNQFQDEIVQLVKGGSPVGNNKADTSTVWPLTEEEATYGGTSDLWGTTWNATEINSSNFGVRLQGHQISGGSGGSFRIDYVFINVTYRDVTSSSDVLLPKAASVVTWNVSSVETPHLLGAYGGQESTDNEPYVITDCWALPDEGVAPVLDSSETPASPDIHQWFSSSWSANHPTELKVASHLNVRFKNMDATQPVAWSFGVDGAPGNSTSLGTMNGSGSVQTLYFGDVTSAQEATLFNSISLYAEGSFSGSSNKREIEAFELHAWLVSDLIATWQLGVDPHASMPDGNPSPFGVSEIIGRLEQYEDPDQSPRWFYLIEDFDGDGEPTSTAVSFRPGTTVKQITGNNSGEDGRMRQVWTITLQESRNFE